MFDKVYILCLDLMKRFEDVFLIIFLYYGLILYLYFSFQKYNP